MRVEEVLDEIEIEMHRSKVGVLARRRTQIGVAKLAIHSRNQLCQTLSALLLLLLLLLARSLALLAFHIAFHIAIESIRRLRFVDMLFIRPLPSAPLRDLRIALTERAGKRRQEATRVEAHCLAHTNQQVSPTRATHPADKH